MNRLLRACLTLVVVLLAGAGPFLRAQTGPLIEKIEIRHVGPPAASDELIKANIRSKPGESYSKINVDDDVRNLYATGYFRNIQVKPEAANQGVSLIYVLQGKPILTEIRFEGNKKYSREKLLRQVTSKVGQPLDERKLFIDAQEIEKIYQKAGYQQSRVEPIPNIQEQSGRGTVTFQISESPKIRIERVQFVGANAFSQKRLRRAIKTRKHWMFSWLTGSGVLKEEPFEEDKEKLTDFYQNKGYIDFEIKDIQFEYPRPNRLVIKLIVFEGRQYKVGAVEFKGNSLFTADEIMSGILVLGRVKRPRMTVGEIFTPQGLIDDLEAIEDFYHSRGYIDVRIHPLKNANTETGTMDLVYQIEEGDKSYIEKIEIRGNIKTKDKVIRRELAVSPGEVFNMVRVEISEQRLEGMNYFEKVDSEVDPTDIPNRKNLIVNVDEADTAVLNLGAGFSSIDQLVGFASFTQSNFDLFNPPYFTGGGQRLRLYAQLGTRRQDYQLTFIEPWFLNQRLALSMDLYHRELNFLSDVFDERRTGVRLGLTKALGRGWEAGVSYTFENIGITDVDEDEAPQIILEEEGNRLVSKVGASVAYNTLNSVILPNRGQRTQLSAELAGGPLGAETDFYKLKLESSWYFPGFFQGHIWEIIGETGVVESYGDSDRVPIFDRWFLGGANSLRGFRFRDVGPFRRGPTGKREPIGGNTYWFGSVEYSIPIIERLRFALFYDIGMVYEDAYEFNFGDVNDNWGIGVRLNIPRVGPLRLDYGIPIRGKGNGRFQFGVGFNRTY